MVEKNITKKYLQDRCFFKDKTVIFSTDFDGLYALIKQLEPSKQKKNIDIIELTKAEKLKLVRENKDNLAKIIEKKGYNEQIDLDAKVSNPTEEYSSALLWEVIKSRADLE